METITKNTQTIVDRLLADKREAQKQAKENFKKPEYQEALKRLRARNEKRGTPVITIPSK
jgi:hypothetical protein